MTGLGAAASLASGVLFIAADEAEAQDAAPARPPSGGTVWLPPLKIEGAEASSTNALQTDTGLNRLPDPLQSTPQTITVIPQVVIEQQHATTVDQVLQYVPGITVATGEGGGGITGDQFRIRGFDASGDLYVDGLRDFGSYVRDSFATENIMVLKGPSSQSFGNGTTGGVIEMDSKKAHLGNESSFEATGGMGPYGRGVLDVNRQLNETTAARVVVMGNRQDVVDRDHVYSDRWGVLGSLGFGLGTDQQVIVDYFHQHSNQRPDFGVPMVSVAGTIGEPVTEYGVRRSTYYGRESDRDLMDADVGTVLYKGQFGDWLTLTNDTRFGHYTRDLKFTPTMCASPGFPFPSTCATDVLAGNLNTPYSIWAVGGTKQTSYGGENVTTAVMRFETGWFRHELVSGVDAYAQHATTNFYLPVGPEPAGTLLHPIFNNSPGFTETMSSANRTKATSWDVGPFISDRVWLAPELSILGGVRWDHYEVDANVTGNQVGTTTNFASPKASLIWEPTAQQTYYFSYARSFTPPGHNITSLSSALGLPSAATQPNLKPEGDETFEIGGKWSLLNDRLGATAALFRVNKSNTSYTDPVTGIATTTDDNNRVQGVELGLTGKITAEWDVQASYSYMDSKIVKSTISPFTPVSADGNRVPYVSKHGASLWSTYDVASLVEGFPGHLLIGGGVNYRSDYYVNNLNTLRIPAVTTVDALVSYDPTDKYHVAINIINLTDALAYSSAFANGYATPVAGRTVTVTAAVRF
ncbi:TonB-dependent receptor [Nitrospirillum viridazoti]|uniref:TonB-dependent receptor n=1 Tax=Nitrospirillum viridazoti TaxID=3144925 RepID=UPI0018E982CF|nr:TonB-dependent siderophore receptor [Nitrospirillum amazonense]